MAHAFHRREAKVLSKSSVLSHKLVYGYIRSIEETVTHHIIPVSVIDLCWQFYNISNLLFCLRCNPNTVYIANIHDTDSKEPMHQTKIDTIGSMYINGCCCTTEFNAFPQDIQDTITPQTTTVLFKCGGWSTSTSHAIIVDTNTFATRVWNLPSICSRPTSVSTCVYGNSVAFSSRNQLLFSVGGQNNNGTLVRGLYFNDIKLIKDDFDWKTVTNLPQRRYNSSAIVVEKYNALMVLGGKEGDNNLNSACVYNIDQNEWKDVACFTTAKRAAGVYCNQWKNEVFFGGGIDDNDSGQSMEWFDFEKDKWNSTAIPDTQLAHKLHPVLWMENNVLLYIASVSKARGTSFYLSSNSAEFIDLRVCKQWNTVIADNLMNHVFGLNSGINLDDCSLLAN